MATEHPAERRFGILQKSANLISNETFIQKKNAALYWNRMQLKVNEKGMLISFIIVDTFQACLENCPFQSTFFRIFEYARTGI